MQNVQYGSYADWYSTGPLSYFVRASGVVGGTISVIEANQPAGDMSDPPVDELVLMRTMSIDIPFEFDFGAGRFSGTERQGDYHLVAPNTASDIQVHAPHSTQLFSMSAVTCRDLLQDEPVAGLDFGALHRQLFRSNLLCALCDRLVDAVRHPEPPSRLFVQSTSMAILAELALISGRQPKRRFPDIYDWRVRRTIEQLDARIGEDLSLVDLAGSVGLSLSHFTALFRAATGLPPHAWVVRRKVERACELMQNPRTSVTEIAHALGFSSSQHFATTFRGRMGMTPSAWRHARLS
jgi:AraC family transcriptional regulator